MTSISINALTLLAGTWMCEASSSQYASDERRQTLRECAEVLKKLIVEYK